MVLLQLSSLIYYHPGGPCRLCTADAHLLVVPPAERGVAVAQNLSYCSAIWSGSFYLQTGVYHPMLLVQVIGKKIGFFQSLIMGLVLSLLRAEDEPILTKDA